MSLLCTQQWQHNSDSPQILPLHQTEPKNQAEWRGLAFLQTSVNGLNWTLSGSVKTSLWPAQLIKLQRRNGCRMKAGRDIFGFSNQMWNHSYPTNSKRGFFHTHKIQLKNDEQCNVFCRRISEQCGTSISLVEQLCTGSNDSDLNSESTRLESRAGHRILSVRWYVFILDHSRKIGKQYLKLGRHHSLPYFSCQSTNNATVHCSSRD